MIHILEHPPLTVRSRNRDCRHLMTHLRLADAICTRDELERDLAMRIHPEMVSSDAARLYIVFASETEVHFCGNWLGATAPMMGSWLRPSLAGRWDGDGPALMLNDLLVSCRNVAAIAAHEVAHILAVDGLFRSSDPIPSATESPDQQSLRMLTSAATVLENPQEANQGHDQNFVRVLLHLRHWLILRGWNVPLNSMLDWKRFTGRRGSEFLEAIGDEPERFACLSLSKVLKIEPPAKFSALWNADAVADIGTDVESVSLGQSVQKGNQMVMSVTDFISGLFRVKQEQATVAERSWRALIIDVATGKETDPEATLAELERLGKTPDQLKDALMKYQRRARLSQQYESLPEIIAGIEKAEADLREAEAAIKAVKEKYQPTINLASFTIQDLRRRRLEAESARRDLIHSGNDPFVESRIDQLKQEREQVLQDTDRRKESSSNKGAMLQSAEKDLRTSASSQAERQVISQQIEKLRAEITAHTQAIEENHRKIQSIASQIEQEMEAYLDPACVA